MASEISKLFVTVGADTSEFQSKMKNVSGTMTNVGAGMMAAGAAIVGSLFGITMKTAEAGDEIAKMAKRTGFSTVALSELSYAATLSGTSLDSIETAIKRMQITLVDATQGLSTATMALDGLGLSVEDLMGLTPEEQFDKITEAVALIEDPTKRAATAVDIFGKSGTDMLPMLADGTQGLQDMKTEAHELGVIFDEEAAQKCEEFSDAMDRLKESLKKAGQQIGEALMPILTNLIENYFVPIIQKIADWIEKNGVLFEWLLKIGGLLIAGGAILVGLGMLAKAITAINAALVVMHSLAGPAGWAKLAAGIAIAAAAIIGINALMGQAESGVTKSTGMTAKEISDYLAEHPEVELPGYQHGGIIPGPRGMPVPVIAHGGEVFAGVHGEYGRGMGNTYQISVGNLMGDELSLRKFARVIKEIIGEDNRRNTFGQVNRGYYYGRSSV